VFVESVYVGLAVLTVDERTVGVSAFLDVSFESGLHTWSGFLETPMGGDMAFEVLGAETIRIALPGGAGADVEVTFASSKGFGIIGLGPPPRLPEATV
jgi:hypothetical protein